MTIRIVEDVVSPVAVSAVDMLTLEFAPDWNEWATYGMLAGGYVASALNFGGNMAKNIGIASLPLAVRSIRDRVKGGVTGKVSRRLSFRPSAVAQLPQGIRQTVVPEFENIKVS